MCATSSKGLPFLHLLCWLSDLSMSPQLHYPKHNPHNQKCEDNASHQSTQEESQRDNICTTASSSRGLPICNQSNTVMTPHHHWNITFIHLTLIICCPNTLVAAHTNENKHGINCLNACPCFKTFGWWLSRNYSSHTIPYLINSNIIIVILHSP